MDVFWFFWVNNTETHNTNNTLPAQERFCRTQGGIFWREGGFWLDRRNFGKINFWFFPSSKKQPKNDFQNVEKRGNQEEIRERRRRLVGWGLPNWVRPVCGAVLRWEPRGDRWGAGASRSPPRASRLHPALRIHPAVPTGHPPPSRPNVWDPDPAPALAYFYELCEV